MTAGKCGECPDWGKYLAFTPFMNTGAHKMGLFTGLVSAKERPDQASQKNIRAIANTIGILSRVDGHLHPLIYWEPVWASSWLTYGVL